MKNDFFEDDFFLEIAEGANESADSLDRFGDEAEESAKQAQALIDTLDGIGHNSEATAKAIDALNGKQEELKQTIGGLSNYMSNLDKSMEKLSSVAEKLSDSLGKVGGAGKKNGEETKKLVTNIDELYDLYKRMGLETDKLKVNLDNLIISEKEYNNLSKLATTYNEQRADSYNALSAQYRAMKVLYDNMTAEERAANKAFVDQLYSMYEAMNMIQQQSGKFQLQVGNYSKAMTGLNIATVQVVREMPTLANSLSQFAIAISNNIPIWVEAMGRLSNENKAMIATRDKLNKEYEEALALGHLEVANQKKLQIESIKTTTVMKSLVKTLFSWQTIIVGLLTVLPMFLRNLERKRKETNNLKESVKDLLDVNKLWEGSIRSISTEEKQSISTLRTLVSVMGDELRTREERLKVAEILRDLYTDELGNYSAEEILSGKAQKSIESLTKTLLEQAKARGILNEISKLYGEYAKQEIELDKIKEKRATAQEKLAKAEAHFLRARDEGSAHAIKNAHDELNAVNEEFDTIKEGMTNIGNNISKLEKMIPVGGLIGELMNGTEKLGKTPLDIADYYFDYVQSLVNLLGEGSNKALAQMELDNQREQANLEKNIKKLEEMRQNANAEELAEINKQIAIIRNIQANAQTEFLLSRQRFLDEMLKSYVEEVEEEQMLSISEEQKGIKDRISKEKAEREKGIREQYEQYALNGTMTAELQEELNRKLVESERQFWVDYLNELKSAGILTVDAYNEIMRNLERAEKNNASKRRRGTKGYSNPIEALLAFSKDYGETDEYGKHRIQEQFKAYADGINSALRSSIGFMRDWIDARKEMADIAVESAKKEVESAKQVLDYEMQARANGYAYNMEIARKEYEEKLAMQRKAEAESKRIARVQQQLDTAQQVSSLITATANIWSAEGLKGILGIPLALAATGAMWASFISAKTQARKLTAVQYGDGMSEYLNYGGSHASGNDIDFGTTKDGRPRRVERGEVIGVINKRNVQKYGVSEVQSIINSLNSGTFEDKYGMAFAPSSPSMVNIDLSKLEKDVWNIRKQGESRTTYANGKTIVQYKNVTRVIYG